MYEYLFKILLIIFQTNFIYSEINPKRHFRRSIDSQTHLHPHTILVGHVYSILYLIHFIKFIKNLKIIIVFLKLIKMDWLTVYLIYFL